MDTLWTLVYIFFMIIFFMIFFMVIMDLFSDHTLGGGAKAVWIIFLAFVPFLTLLVYMVARGKGMAERSMERARRDQSEADSYIRRVASASPSDEISKAKALLDSGTISADEFERIKTRVTA